MLWLHMLSLFERCCVFIGYSPSHKGYKCLHASGKIYIARHVVFDEFTFPYAIDSAFPNHTTSDSQSSHSITSQQVHHLSTLPIIPILLSDSTNNPTSVSSESSGTSTSVYPVHQEINQELQQGTISNTSPLHTYPSSNELIHNSSLPQTLNSPQRQSNNPTIPSHPPQNTHQMITTGKSGILKPKVYIATLIHKEPNIVQKALSNSRWLQAMKEKYDALIRNGTWTLVPRQANHQVVENKWIYIIKYNTNGSVAKYKARLVAKGFQQAAGVNYFETFSPIIKPALSE